MPAVHTTPLPPLPDTAIRSIEQAKWHLDAAIRIAENPSLATDHLRQAHAGIANAIGHLGYQPEGGAL